MPAAPIRERALTVADVVKVVADYYGVEVKALLAPERPLRLTWIRHIAMYLAREVVRPRPSYPEVGVYFKRDQGSVRSGILRVMHNASEQDWVTIREIQRRLEEGT